MEHTKKMWLSKWFTPYAKGGTRGTQGVMTHSLYVEVVGIEPTQPQMWQIFYQYPHFRLNRTQSIRVFTPMEYLKKIGWCDGSWTHAVTKVTDILPISPFCQGWEISKVSNPYPMEHTKKLVGVVGVEPTQPYKRQNVYHIPHFAKMGNLKGYPNLSYGIHQKNLFNQIRGSISSLTYNANIQTFFEKTKFYLLIFLKVCFCSAEYLLPCKAS